MSARRKGFLTCGGLAAGVLVFLVILGLAVGPQKKTPSSDAAPASPSVTAAKTSQAASPRASHPAGSAPPAKPKAAAVQHLTHGPQSGFQNCTIQYTDAQMGAGTSTFTGYIFADNGAAYPTSDSANDSVMFELTVTDAGGGTHNVSENFGSGSRTAADNPGGSDWFTVNQGDVQVSADNAHGVVASTVPVALAQVTSVKGDIVVMGNNDNSVTTKDCAVRPGHS